jgi:hypothetical protein
MIIDQSTRDRFREFIDRRPAVDDNKLQLLRIAIDDLEQSGYLLEGNTRKVNAADDDMRTLIADDDGHDEGRDWIPTAPSETHGFGEWMRKRLGFKLLTL